MKKKNFRGISSLGSAISLIYTLGLRNSLLYISLLPLRLLKKFSDRLLDLKKQKRSHLMIYHLLQQLEADKRVKLSPTFQQDIYNYFYSIGVPVNINLHRFLISVNGIESKYYLSEYQFYKHVEPVLNNTSLITAYSDKNFYSTLFKKVKQPDTVLRLMHGRYLDKDYIPLSDTEAEHTILSQSGQMLIKPSLGSGRGRKIFLITGIDGKIYKNNTEINIHELKSKYPYGFIIQKRINQHHKFSEIYPHSLNTVRLMTLRFEETIHLLSATVKYGNNNHYVDNVSAGGLACGVHKDGTINDVALDSALKAYHKHPQSGVSFKNRSVVGYKKLVETVKNLHQNLHYFDIISWDMAIDEYEQPVLIELNLRNQGIIFQQVTFGPLFG